MSSVIDLYERLSTAEDEKARARIVAEAFEALEERYPHLSETATRSDLRETELRLLREIEQVRLETEKVRAGLQTEIERVHADLQTEIEKVRADLQTEIEKVRAELQTEIEKVRAELRETELRLTKEIGEVRMATEKVRADLKVEIEKVRGEIARSHSSWLRWSFLFWVTQLGAVLLLLWRVWPQS